MDSNTKNAIEERAMPPERREQVLARLMGILSQRHGLQAIVDYGYDLLDGAAVSVTDTAMKLLARSSQARSDDPVLRQQELEGILSEQTLKAFRDDRQLERLQAARKAYRIHFPPDPGRGLADVPGGMVIAPIRVGATLVGYIVAAGMREELPPTTEDVVDLLAQASSVELQKSDFFMNTRGIAYEALLNDMLEGRAGDREQLERRFRMLGRRLRDEHYVLVTSPEEASQDRLGREVSQATMRTFFPGSTSTVFRQAIVLLVSLDEGRELPDGRQDLLSFLVGHRLRVGVSGPFRDLTRAPEHHRLASEALRLGRALVPERPVTRFSEVAPFALLEAADAEYDLVQLCEPRLHALWVADHRNDREMLRTLFCYVRHAKSVERASGELHIHRNTLFYRIRRVADLAGLDLEDGGCLARVLLTEDVIRYRESGGGRLPGTPLPLA